MKAGAVFPGSQAVRLVDPDPPARTGQTGVTLRMLEVGLCGTDGEICAFGQAGGGIKRVIAMAL